MKTSKGLLLVLTTLFVPAVWAAEIVELNVVRLPERRNVELRMLPTRRIPDADLKAKIRFEEGQSRIEIQYDNMKSAVLFAGDVTCYVLWAVNRDGGVENLGELWVRPERDKDSMNFSTGLRTFALMVTAEPYYQVDQPSSLLIAWNDISQDPQAPTDKLSFSAFADAPKFGLETLANVRYDGNTPLDVLQAEKVFEIAQRVNAKTLAPAIYQEADIALQQARVMARSSQARRGAQEYARRSVASSNEAIRISVREQRARDIEERIAQRQAAAKQLEERAAEAEAAAEKSRGQAEAAMADLRKQQQEAETAVAGLNREIEIIRREREAMDAQKRELETSLQSMRSEQAQLQASLETLAKDLARVKQERAALEGRLQKALSQVAETRESARGLIVNLPDILFDVNKAELKPEASMALSKLAGILLIMQDLNLRIEGHTDSTGSAIYNLELSRQRANSVFDLLSRSGIDPPRMSAFGYGLERPMADNATSEGRSRNRRVEIIIAEGVVKEAPPDIR